ncbi:MAG: hypothetical protein HYX69_18225 [Planctomycetia bacterium]|nr:hypothetical protein [Planctomycetia bacterium]
MLRWPIADKQAYDGFPMAQTQTLFDDLQTTAAEHGAAEMFRRLADHLRQEKQYHELFDARLMEARHALGLPVIMTKSLDDLDEPVRTRMEEAYIAACREVGGLLLAEGRVREAWMYLRPVGERQEITAALERIPRDTENYEQIIEVALYEGVCPRLGFEYVLAHYGTCNAITLFDGQMHSRPATDRQEVAALLVQHLHGELLRNVKADIARREGAEPAGESLRELVATREWLFENDNYHVDTTHLAAVVRFALGCDDPAVLRAAHDLTEYGRGLSGQYQFPGQEPFVDTYRSHGLFFQALLGENAAEAIGYFRERASGATESGPAEVLVALLARMGRNGEAFEAAVELLRPEMRTSGFAPSTLELASRAGRYERLMDVCRERDDPLGFAAGLVEKQRG